MAEKPKKSEPTEMMGPRPEKSGKREPVNEICTRPKHRTSKQGKFGAQVRLQANYFKLTNQPDWTLYQYRVDILPDIESTLVKKAMLRTHKEKLGSYLFDGTMLFTCNPLPQPLELNSFREEDKQPINIKIRLAATVEKGDHHYFQIFNIIVRKCLEHMQLVLVGRNYYDANAGIQVPQYRFNIWPGFVTSIRQHEAGVLMCAEISHKVMRSETVLDILANCQRKNPNSFTNDFKREMIGSIVITHYNNKTYKVTDVDFSTTPAGTFKKRDGTSISYAEYYRERYGISKIDLTQPLLVSKATERNRRAGEGELIYLIPQLCNCTGITDEMRSNFQLMRALADHTRILPSERIRRLMTFHGRLTSKPAIAADLKNWDLQLGNKLVEVPGRVFPMQKIIFGNKQEDTRNAEWDLQRNPKQFYRGAQPLKDWVVMCLDRQLPEVMRFMQNVSVIAGKMGFNILKPRSVGIRDDRPDAFANAIKGVIETSTPRLIFCVVSNNQQQRYMAIKKKLCVERGIPSQVMLSKNLTHKNVGSIACKVAVQMNCKLGGTPWTVDLSSAVKDLMVVGFDVCHEKSATATDFGAMVASVDQNFGRYYSAITKQAPGEELSKCIIANLGSAITEYRRANNDRLPAHLIIYRDGVGEGQIPFVYDYEVKEIKKRLGGLYASKNMPLKFSFVIVTKRINTRIFNNGNNPSPGTVVDDVITDPLKYDFFIVSQNVRQGTVAPTAYNVIEDTTGLSPDMMQYITFKLCHLYFNWNGTVRVPAPVQYAHKLAMFASQTIKQPAHPDLKNLLYFL